MKSILDCETFITKWSYEQVFQSPIMFEEIAYRFQKQSQIKSIIEPVLEACEEFLFFFIAG